MKFLKKEKGFTLIELLVVIAIIGVLTTIVLSSLAEARQKAKITQFQQVIAELQKGLELYYLDHGQYPRIADTSDQVTLCGYHSTRFPSNSVNTEIEEYYPVRNIDSSLLYNPYYGCIRIATSGSHIDGCDTSNLGSNAQSYIIQFRALNGIKIEPYWLENWGNLFERHCIYSN